MPAVNLTWYAKPVRRIMRDVKALKRKEIAEIQAITTQAVSKSLNNGKYETELEEWIQILDKAGYEIKAKEGV